MKLILDRRFHSHYPNDFARPSFEKLIPNSRHFRRLIRYTQKQGKPAQVASVMNGTCTCYTYIRMQHDCVRVQTAAGDERLASSENYEGNPYVCTSNWAKYMIINNSRALSDLV